MPKAKSKSSDAASVKANGAKANGEQLTKAEVRKQLKKSFDEMKKGENKIEVIVTVLNCMGVEQVVNVREGNA